MAGEPINPTRPRGPEGERRIEVWTPEILKRLITESCAQERTGLCHWENLPSEIQLGSFSQKGLSCLRETGADPQHGERAAVIQWEPVRGKIMMTRDDNLQVGDYDRVPVVIRSYQEPLKVDNQAAHDTIATKVNRKQFKKKLLNGKLLELESVIRY